MAFLFQRNNGYYYAVYNDGLRRIWQSLGTKDEAEAEAKFEALKPELERQRPKTLQEFAQAIQKYVELNNRKGTADLYRVALQHLIVCLGNKPLKFLIPMDGERFKEYLLNK